MKVNYRQSPQVVKERHLKIASDYNSGIPVKDIMERHDCSKETVYYALRKLVNAQEK